MTLTVYLIHFSGPLPGGARHYLGQTARQPSARIAEHVSGAGARLTRRAVRAGLTLTLARTWPVAPSDLERRLKRGGGLARLCPVCRESVVAGSRRPDRASRHAVGYQPAPR